MRISESRDRRAHQPTAAELKQQANRDRWRAQYPSLYSSRPIKAYRSWDYFPPGLLSFELWSGRQNRRLGREDVGPWHERTTKCVEEYLNNAIVARVSTAVLVKHKRAEAEEQARFALKPRSVNGARQRRLTA